MAGERWDATFNCQTVGLRPVLSASERVELAGFSVLPPQGGNWCQKWQPNGITFVTNPLIGTVVDRTLGRSEVAHLVSAFAEVVEAGEPKPATIQEVRAYFESRARRGAGYQWYPAPSRSAVTRWRPDRPILVLEPVEHFRTVSSKVVAESSLGTDCVSSEAVIEETYPKTLTEPEAGLIGESRDLLCYHPHRSGLLWIGYNEVWLREAVTTVVQGTALPTRPSLLEMYRSQLEAFVRSVRFE